MLEKEELFITLIIPDTLVSPLVPNNLLLGAAK
jgi:hypothetical protein